MAFEWFKAFGGLMALASYLTGRKQRQDDEFKQISKAFRRALIETQAYLEDIADTGERDRGRERALAESWGGVSALVMPYDEQFRDSCWNFAEYWSKPTRSPLKYCDDLLEMVSALKDWGLVEGIAVSGKRLQFKKKAKAGNKERKPRTIARRTLAKKKAKKKITKKRRVAKKK